MDVDVDRSLDVDEWTDHGAEVTSLLVAVLLCSPSRSQRSSASSCSVGAELRHRVGHEQLKACVGVDVGLGHPRLQGVEAEPARLLVEAQQRQVGDDRYRAVAPKPAGLARLG